MAIITIEDCQGWIIGEYDPTHNTELELAMDAAVASVQRHCGRTFETPAAATARTFVPSSCARVWVDDISSTTDLVVKTDDNDDGTFETTWASTDYVLHPLDGRSAGEYRPYHYIEAVESRTFPRWNQRRNVVQVTAKWGWTTVPDAVKQAALMQTAADFARRGSPHGVAAFGEFGPIRVRGSLDPRVVEMLAPYRHPRLAFGIGG